ncbi:hypothetical protein CSKR_108942 [Clonorchis sinensis]|uniref:Uncharacterized protein n=1 Tax=Clonorchis sinensis TaxID=79923 RepID=A0A3R7GXA4_CLOSI|nr:hypothetical protein CSKR_108942 [Clonorchis sinensis]
MRTFVRWIDLESLHCSFTVSQRVEITCKRFLLGGLVHHPVAPSGRIQGCLRLASEEGIQCRSVYSPTTSVTFRTSSSSKGFGHETFICMLVMALNERRKDLCCEVVYYHIRTKRLHAIRQESKHLICIEFGKVKILNNLHLQSNARYRSVSKAQIYRPEDPWFQPNLCSGLHLTRLGKPGSISALLLPMSDMAARQRKGATAEQLFPSDAAAELGYQTVEYLHTPSVVYTVTPVLEMGAWTTYVVTTHKLQGENNPKKSICKEVVYAELAYSV